MRRASIVFVTAAVALAIVLLAGQIGVAVELAIISASVVILSRIVKRSSLKAEAARLIAGTPLYLLGVAVQTVTIALLSDFRILTPLALTIGASLFPGVALAFCLLSVSRLRRPGEKPRGARVAFFLILGVLLTATGSPSILHGAVATCAGVWAFPRGWLKNLARDHRRRAVQLALASPFAFVFATRLSLGEQAASNVGVPWDLGTASTMVRVFVATYWLCVLLHLALLWVRGFSLRVPIRVRLGLTYLLSTALPGLLTIVFIVVAVYAGIGALRARSARNLVVADLQALAARLREGPRSRASDADSLAEAVYLRMAVDSAGVGEGTSSVTPREGAGDWLTQALPLLSETGLGPLDTGPAAGEPADRRPPRGPEIWVRVASHSMWSLPDTVPALPGWTNGTGAGTAILPVQGARIVYAAAQSAGGNACLVRTLLRPLSVRVLKRYSQALGCDVIIDPAPRWNVRTEVGGGMVVGADRSWSFWPEAPAVTTVTDSGRSGFVHRSLYHGVSDLHLAGGRDEPTRVVALIMVRTSLAELISALYSTGGMNTAVVLLLLILASLILVAVLFSSYLGFSLSKSITASVAALRRGTERLGEGDLDTRIELSTTDELSALAGSFNRMASDLKRLLQEVARRERIEREIQIARQIQVNMLPAELPDVEGYEIAGESYPAQEVAGDYYDVIVLDDERMAVVVADVSGKGVAAAMLMSNLQASLSVVMHQDQPLDVVVQRLNTLVIRTSTPEMFITLFVGVINLRSGVLEYVNAGHDPPIVLRAGQALDLCATGLILGMFRDARYGVSRIQLIPHDVVVLYSDGITDAFNHADQEFGRERLIETLRESLGQSAHAAVTMIMQRVHAHVGVGVAPTDDLTVLAVVVGGPDNGGGERHIGSYDGGML